MCTIKTIETIIQRKKDIERMIDNRKQALSCNEDGKNAFSVRPSNHGSGYNFNIDWSAVAPLIEKNIQDLQCELDSINKKVDAIGALMGSDKAD